MSEDNMVPVLPEGTGLLAELLQKENTTECFIHMTMIGDYRPISHIYYTEEAAEHLVEVLNVMLKRLKEVKQCQD